MKRFFIGLLVALIAFSTTAPPAKAEEFVRPSLQNITKILMRFGAINIKDDEILDSYAQIQECKLYQHFYRDDFKWNEFRAAFRESIRDNIESYPMGISYEGTLQLGRYDFKEKLYRFTDKTKIVNTNMFILDGAGDMRCSAYTQNLFPSTYSLVLDQPLYVNGIPLSKDDAKEILKRMEANGNKDHLIYARFNVNIVFVQLLTRKKDNQNLPTGKLVQKANDSAIRLDARAASIDFFEDEGRTKQVYSFRP